MIHTSTSPPVPPAPRRHGSARDRIIARSLELFSDRGYNGVSMSDIAQATGVTKAALYHHFTDKEALFLDVVRTRTAHLAGELDRIATDSDDLETLLTRVAVFLLDEGLGAYRQLQVDLLTNVDESRRQEHLQETRAALFRIIPCIREAQERGEIAPDIDLEAAVPLYFSMIGGQIRRLALASGDESASLGNAELAALIVRIWLTGTRPINHGEIA